MTDADWTTPEYDALKRQKGEIIAAEAKAHDRSDEVVELRRALRNMADAYQRLIRTNCTPEMIAQEPWRCMEYIEAERLCKRSFKLQIDLETLKRQIAAEPDGMSCEAGVLHPEAPITSPQT